MVCCSRRCRPLDVTVSPSTDTVVYALSEQGFHRCSGRRERDYSFAILVTFRRKMACFDQHLPSQIVGRHLWSDIFRPVDSLDFGREAMHRPGAVALRH